MSLLWQNCYIGVIIFLKKYENKPIMTKAWHIFDTIKVHYIVRSSRLPIPEGVLPHRVSHPNPIYDLGCNPKWNKLICIEQSQIQADDHSRGRFSKTKICWKYLTFKTKVAIIILLLERLRPNFAHFEEFWRHSSTTEDRWVNKMEGGSKKPYII